VLSCCSQTGDINYNKRMDPGKGHNNLATPLMDERFNENEQSIFNIGQ
jgi:hypothetical protein